MIDPKMENKPIVQGTLCRVGSHTFIHTGGKYIYAMPPPDDIRCSCGAYNWQGWEEAQEKA